MNHLSTLPVALDHYPQMVIDIWEIRVFGFEFFQDEILAGHHTNDDDDHVIPFAVERDVKRSRNYIRNYISYSHKPTFCWSASKAWWERLVLRRRQVHCRAQAVASSY